MDQRKNKIHKVQKKIHNKEYLENPFNNSKIIIMATSSFEDGTKSVRS